jgi:hypothetical protein
VSGLPSLKNVANYRALLVLPSRKVVVRVPPECLSPCVRYLSSRGSRKNGSSPLPSAMRISILRRTAIPLDSVCNGSACCCSFRSVSERELRRNNRDEQPGVCTHSIPLRNYNEFQGKHSFTLRSVAKPIWYIVPRYKGPYMAQAL